ncbi:MAG: hypothetical protein AAF675_05625 [Pseudomonadota bacterium]
MKTILAAGLALSLLAPAAIAAESAVPQPQTPVAETMEKEAGLFDRLRATFSTKGVSNPHWQGNYRFGRKHPPAGR